MQKEWFEEWFDSKYYHILYKNRDEDEAKVFIHNLIKHLNPKQDATFLDLACGKGRHSVTINQMGYDVTGLDLSENNIKIAKQSANDELRFAVHDMREIYSFDAFDYVLNLFTSFGYFDNHLDNLNVLTSIKRTLKQGGTMVIDFFNTQFVIDNLNTKERKTLDGIAFNIEKEIDNGKVVKHIKFEADGKQHHHKETVQLIDFNQFQRLFDQVGLQIIDVFGNYNLDAFNEGKSERLIILAQKL